MKKRIGINGFGRMGRLALRAAWDFPEIEFVHINETGGNGIVSAHLIEFDSVHGKWQRNIHGETDKVFIEGKMLGHCGTGCRCREQGDDLGRVV